MTALPPPPPLSGTFSALEQSEYIEQSLRYALGQDHRYFWNTFEEHAGNIAELRTHAQALGPELAASLARIEAVLSQGVSWTEKYISIIEQDIADRLSPDSPPSPPPQNTLAELWFHEFKHDLTYDTRPSILTEASPSLLEAMSRLNDLLFKAVLSLSSAPERMERAMIVHLAVLADMHDDFTAYTAWENLRRDAPSINSSLILHSSTRKEQEKRIQFAHEDAWDILAGRDQNYPTPESTTPFAIQNAPHQEVRLQKAIRIRDFFKSRRLPFIRYQADADLGPSFTVSDTAKSRLVESMTRVLRNAEFELEREDWHPHVPLPAKPLFSLAQLARKTMAKIFSRREAERLRGLPWLAAEARLRVEEVLSSPGTDLEIFCERLLDAMGVDVIGKISGGIHFAEELEEKSAGFFSAEDRSIHLDNDTTLGLKALMRGNRSAPSVAALLILVHEAMHAESPAQAAQFIHFDQKHTAYPARGTEEGLVEYLARETVKNVMGPSVPLEAWAYEGYVDVIRRIHQAHGPDAILKLWNQPDDGQRMRLLADLEYKPVPTRHREGSIAQRLASARQAASQRDVAPSVAVAVQSQQPPAPSTSRPFLGVQPAQPKSLAQTKADSVTTSSRKR